MQNKHTLFGLLQACTSLRQAQQIHCQMITKNIASSETILLNKLLSFCAISDDGCLDYACAIFSRIVQPSVLALNLMIRGHSLYNKPEETLFFFKGMQQAGLSPNNYTYPFLLKSCILLSETKHGEVIHGHAVKSGFELDVFVSSALLHLYASSQRMESAELLFVKMPIRNVVSWTTMIAGYAHCGKGADAIRVFKEMQANNIQPNHVTLVSVLAACSLTGDLDMGRFVHGYVRQSEMQIGTVLETALVDMYAKCGRLDISRELFNEIPDKNIISWNAIIRAHNHASQHKEAISLFYSMRSQKVKPDEVTSLGILTACAHLGNGGLGQAIHAYSIKNNFDMSGALGTALIDMYSKIGDTDSAAQIFHSSSHKDAFTWTAMIAGLAMHGQGKDALDLFETMLKAGIHPDEVTYMAVISACSHAGLVQKGCGYFECMTTLHGIQPREEHYGCMVDLLSRAGLLEEAEKLVESMPVRPNIAIYTALLSACRIYRNDDLAQRVTKRIIELKPEKAGVHVLLSNVYAKEGRWQGVKLAREVMKEKGIKNILDGARSSGMLMVYDIQEKVNAMREQVVSSVVLLLVVQERMNLEFLMNLLRMEHTVSSESFSGWRKLLDAVMHSLNRNQFSGNHKSKKKRNQVNSISTKSKKDQDVDILLKDLSMDKTSPQSGLSRYQVQSELSTSCSSNVKVDSRMQHLSILSVDTKLLRAENLLRRIFCSKVINSFSPLRIAQLVAQGLFMEEDVEAIVIKKQILLRHQTIGLIGWITIYMDL